MGSLFIKVQTKMCLPESPFILIHLLGQAGKYLCWCMSKAKSTIPLRSSDIYSQDIIEINTDP